MKIHTIRFRIDDRFLLMMLHKMEKAKIYTYSQFIRDAITKVSIREQCRELQKIYFEINRIGVNLNQIAKNSNQFKGNGSLSKEFVKMRSNLDKLLIKVEKYDS